MKEFQVNSFITLKLEEKGTSIYVNKEFFSQCKYLLLNIPIAEVTSLDEVTSIDEAAESLDHSSEQRTWESPIRIDLETEFWGHCSNMQVWSENNYNTRLLHSNIAFPLLQKLTKVGDVHAKKIFKEEIAKRYEMGIKSTKDYLIEQRFLDFLNREEFWSILPEETEILCNIEKKLNLKSKIYTEKEDYLFIPEIKDHIGFSLKNDKINVIIFSECTRINQAIWHWVLDELTKLKSLKILGIENCKLTKLPKEIKRIESIEMLLLGGNCLKKIPNYLRKVKNLQSIEIDKKLKNRKIIEKLREKGVKIYTI